jgi:phospholipid/cholesterol/gamma-HCH transport system ATP-binding protein
VLCVTNGMYVTQHSIHIENLHVGFERTPVLQGVTCTLPTGCIYGLIGPSCGGKSTLLKAIAGLIPYDLGSIKNIPSQSGLMFQEGALFDSLSVFDNVAFPLVNGNVPSSRLPVSKQKELSKIVTEILGRVGLAWACDKMPGELSGGMRRRVSLARTLVSRPDLVLLDDPTSGLDPVASSVIMELIVELQRELSSTMIIVSHDLRRLLPVVDELLCLFEGTVKFLGPVSEVKRSAPQDVLEFIACRYDL